MACSSHHASRSQRGCHLKADILNATERPTAAVAYCSKAVAQRNTLPTARAQLARAGASNELRADGNDMEFSVSHRDFDAGLTGPWNQG